MTVFLDDLSSGPLADATKQKVTEGEIPHINGATPSKPIPNGTSNGINGHTNGLKTAASNGETRDAFTLHDKYAYTPKKLKVFTIGAGFSGLLMAHKFQHRFPEMQEMVDHTIFEAHSEVGGTWLVNDYPGVQCDVPAHIYVCSQPACSS